MKLLHQITKFNIIIILQKEADDFLEEMNSFNERIYIYICLCDEYERERERERERVAFMFFITD